MRVRTEGVLGLMIICGTALGEDAVPLGGEFQVNTYTTEEQRNPVLAADAEGNFVVVWASEGSYSTDSLGLSIQAQRYGAIGDTVGEESQVNSYTMDNQWNPAVAMNAEGDFVVVWQSRGSLGTDSDGYSIQGQRYDSGGASMGGEFQINTYKTASQQRPSVAVADQGDFVVVWDSGGSIGSDTDSRSIQMQRYDDAGNPLGGEFQVNTTTTNAQDHPAVAMDALGNFVVVWTGGYGPYGGSMDIYGQRFSVNGAPLGGEFQVNSYTTGHQYDPAVATGAEGNFAVVWTSYYSAGTDTDGPSIQAQMYDSKGGAVGGQFQVNAYTTDSQHDPVVAIDSLDSFVVAWRSIGSYGTDVDRASIQVQRYDAHGAAIGGQFQVNSYSTLNQRSPSVVATTAGDFVVAWQSSGSYGTDTDNWSVQGQRYSVPVFTDGFESGDTSDWSRTVQ